MSHCEQDPTCPRPAQVLHTTVHGDCAPGFPVGVTIAVCQHHARARDATLRRLSQSLTRCPFCELQLGELTRTDALPEWSLT